MSPRYHCSEGTRASAFVYETVVFQYKNMLVKLHSGGHFQLPAANTTYRLLSPFYDRQTWSWLSSVFQKSNETKQENISYCNTYINANFHIYAHNEKKAGGGWASWAALSRCWRAQPQSRRGKACQDSLLIRRVQAQWQGRRQISHSRIARQMERHEEDRGGLLLTEMLTCSPNCDTA